MLAGARDWVGVHLTALVTVTPMLVVVGVVQGVNTSNWPGYTNDDPATYLARAWAVQTGRGAHHSLAPYTYWYDHVPFGWIQIVPITWVTHAFRPGAIADVTGRQIALGYVVVGAWLVYVVARRLGCATLWAVAAMGLFALSPLSLQYLRQMYIDSLGLPWLLAAFALALSPNRRLWIFAASGACLAGACLTKETFVLWLPALVWLVWVRADPQTRRMCLTAFGGVTLVLLLLYPMYAVLKGELVPGKGHVSLIGAIEWQLAQRAASGSVFTRGTDANQMVLGWFNGNRFLWAGGLLSLPVIMLRRIARPLVAALGVPVLYMLHPGYLPAMFIIGVIPFAALSIVCAADIIWKSSVVPDLVAGIAARVTKLWRAREPARHARRVTKGDLVDKSHYFWYFGCLAGVVVACTQFVPSWVSGDRVAMTANDAAELRAAEAWVEIHVPRTDTLLVDDNLWIDLVDDGYRKDNVVWFWELDSDPDVERRFPEGWRQIDYVVVTDTVIVNVEAVPTGIPSVVEAIAHSTAMASFGAGPDVVQVRKVGAALTDDPPPWFPPSDMKPISTSTSGKGQPA